MYFSHHWTMIWLVHLWASPYDIMLLSHSYFTIILTVLHTVRGIYSFKQVKIWNGVTFLWTSVTKEEGEACRTDSHICHWYKYSHMETVIEILHLFVSLLRPTITNKKDSSHCSIVQFFNGHLWLWWVALGLNGTIVTFLAPVSGFKLLSHTQ